MTTYPRVFTYYRQGRRLIAAKKDLSPSLSKLRTFGRKLHRHIASCSSLLPLNAPVNLFVYLSKRVL